LTKSLLIFFWKIHKISKKLHKPKHRQVIHQWIAFCPVSFMNELTQTKFVDWVLDSRAQNQSFDVSLACVLSYSAFSKCCTFFKKKRKEIWLKTKKVYSINIFKKIHRRFSDDWSIPRFTKNRCLDVCFGSLDLTPSFRGEVKKCRKRFSDRCINSNNYAKF
jgi:hypothetical protein